MIPFLKTLGMCELYPARRDWFRERITGIAKCLRRRTVCEPDHKSKRSALDRTTIPGNREMAGGVGTDTALGELCPGVQASERCPSLF